MKSPHIYCSRFLLPIDRPPIEDGALLVVDGEVVAVGTYAEVSAAHSQAEITGFGDSALLPPFVNAHTHLELTAFNDWAKAADESSLPDDFVDWILRLVRVKQTVTPEQITTSLAQGLVASLRAGTGAVGDICTTLDAAEAYAASPLRGSVYAEVLGQAGETVQTRLDAIATVTKSEPSATLTWGVSPHAPYTLSPQTLDAVFAFARRAGLASCIHLAESREESSFLKDTTGAIAEKLYPAAQWPVDLNAAPACSPVRALCEEGRLNAEDLAVHGVEVDGDDIALLREKGCSVVLCPRSNASLKGGRAPVAQYLEAGVNLGLGTDSLASSPSLSIWDELAFALEWFKGEASPRQWLEIATLGGARALGLQKNMGSLSPGREASFQVVKVPGSPDVSEIESTLCSAADKVSVTHLFLKAQNCLP